MPWAEVSVAQSKLSERLSRGAGLPTKFGLETIRDLISSASFIFFFSFSSTFFDFLRVLCLQVMVRRARGIILLAILLLQISGFIGQDSKLLRVLWLKEWALFTFSFIVL